MENSYDKETALKALGIVEPVDLIQAMIDNSPFSEVVKKNDSLMKKYRELLIERDERIEELEQEKIQTALNS